MRNGWEHERRTLKQRDQEVVIGSRGSALALTQSNWIKAGLERLRPDLRISIEVIKTTGDRIQTRFDPAEKLEKGLFTRELEEALIAGRVDLAVHSLKDLPVELPEGLVLGAVPERESAWDVLVLKRGLRWDALPEGAVVGTGSERRGRQWLERFPHTRVEGVRGNVDTRLRKLEENDAWAGILLAEAGLNRLRADVKGFEVVSLGVETLVPAPGQGALGLEMRKDDDRIATLLSGLHHEDTALAVMAERTFLSAMGGGCQAPLGAFARIEGEDLELTGIYYEGESRKGVRKVRKGKRGDAGEIAMMLAEGIRSE